MPSSVFEHRCPLQDKCSFFGKTEDGLRKHWHHLHKRTHGTIEDFRNKSQKLKHGLGSSSVAGGSSSSSGPPPDMASTAMAHLNEMTFRFGQTEAEKGRAKQMATSCLQHMKAHLIESLAPHVHTNVEVSEIVDPLMQSFERVNSRKRERNERAKSSAETHPPLRVYPRKLGVRPAVLGKRKCVDGVIAYAYDTCLEEFIEREIVYDNSLLTEMIVSDQYWTKRAKELQGGARHDLDRTFSDQVDGDVWQDHEVLGDPEYDGPTRAVLQGYCDDVDVPNGLGPAAGHSKLYIQTVTLVNRPPRGRMSMRAQWLSTVCLSSDFKIFKAHAIMSGDGTLGFCLGAQLRRLWTRGTIRLPIEVSPEPLAIRVFLSVWQADGMAMGDVCGTNTSFSKAINICNTCEDMDQRSAAKKRPCSFLLCRCGDANTHSLGCTCHFRLRTPTRDSVSLSPENCSSQEMTRLGITTMQGGLTGIQGIHRATPGPKDPMHTLHEGRTAQLAAITLWNFVNEGYATREQLQRRASEFDWTPGSPSTGFFRPSYLPDKIFVKTKVEQPDGSWVWGPHKDVKLPGSAVGVSTFTIMSTEFFRPFVPEGPLPSWLLAWQLHAVGFGMLLRYSFTLHDLLHIENLFIRSETIIIELPSCLHVWIPKAHWVLHLAHDVRRWGPTRLLATLLNEMKNAQFKKGASRSNYHNPVKSVAEFWAAQSDYQLQTLSLDTHSAVKSAHATVLVCGPARRFKESVAVALLLQHSRVRY